MLSTSGPAIVSAIDASDAGGSITPTLTVLDGAVQYLLQRQATGVGRLPAIVLATDGRPEGCFFDSVDSTAQFVSAAYADHGLKTFVIGLGNVDGLNQIATAGGTTAAIETSGTVKDEILSALNVIQSTVSCKYEMPVPMGGDVIDPGKLNVDFLRDDGSSATYPQVSGAAACGDQTGWYYDDPASPTEIELWPRIVQRGRAHPGRGAGARGVHHHRALRLHRRGARKSAGYPVRGRTPRSTRLPDMITKKGASYFKPVAELS